MSRPLVKVGTRLLMDSTRAVADGPLGVGLSLGPGIGLAVGVGVGLGVNANVETVMLDSVE